MQDVLEPWIGAVRIKLRSGRDKDHSWGVIPISPFQKLEGLFSIAQREICWCGEDRIIDLVLPSECERFSTCRRLLR
jgi:hypothetical protein